MDTPPTAPTQAVEHAVDVPAYKRKRPVWSVPVLVVAVIVVGVLSVVGFTGLFANPVKSFNADSDTPTPRTFVLYLFGGPAPYLSPSAVERSLYGLCPPGVTPRPRRSSSRSCC